MVRKRLWNRFKPSSSCIYRSPRSTYDTSPVTDPWGRNSGLKSLQLAVKREIHNLQRRTVIRQNEGRDFRDRF